MAGLPTAPSWPNVPKSTGLGQYIQGSIYRILRQIGDSGLVSSSWDTSKDGPARRIYDLTDTGSMFLKTGS
ncbi:MAG: hypothetical protein CMQ07_04605 [Gammaproteobacteria bacterium]|nr:hypothetical protein [Gammaproteobacteria bacterium]